MPRIIRPFLFLLVLTPHFAAAASIADFSDYTLFGPRGGAVLPGRLFTPPEAISDPTRPRPLIVFLHGGGASGTNNTTQVEHTPDYLLDEAKRRAAYLYIPQTATNWSSISVIDQVMTMIRRAVDDLNANPNRLYATGYSNGGGGTWNIINRYPDELAAAMPISGVLPAPGFNPANLLETPIFAVHSRDDATVSVNRSRDVVNGILQAAGEPLPTYPPLGNTALMLVSNPAFEIHRVFADSVEAAAGITFDISPVSNPDLDLMYLELPDGNHTGAVGAYFAPPVYQWMFSHTLLVPEPATLAWAACGSLALGLQRSKWRRR